MGKILRALFSNRVTTYGAIIDTESFEIKNHVFSEIYFKLYESAEIRFILKYVPSKSIVVELGSSIGVVSSILSVRKEPKKVFCIEANPNLISIVNKNLKLNSNMPYQVDNYAITSSSNSNGSTWFSFGDDNTTGKKTEGKGDIEVPAISLTDYLYRNDIDEYVMISDIEGEEYELLFNDSDALKNCKMLIIELHETHRGGGLKTVDEMKEQIVALGFKVKDSYGPNFVFFR